jgi:hypothetical protein
MNRGTIRSLVANMVEDPNQSRYTPAQYNEAIDIAQKEFAFDSKAYYKDASTYTVSADDADYDLPSDFWLEKQVTHKGIELSPITRAQLQAENNEDWTDDTGTPTHYIIDPEEARKQILLYRIPQSGDAGANLILTYYPVPGTPGSDGVNMFDNSALMIQFDLGIAAKAGDILLSYRTQTPEILVKRNDFRRQYGDKVVMAIDSFGNTKKAPMRFKTTRG